MSGFDNSDIQQKISVRNRVFDYPVSYEKCVEFFAGYGEMRRRFWAKICKEVISIDERDLPGLTHVGNNINYLHLSKRVQVIDCDAYGLVLPFIQQIRQVAETPQLIFFTDGTPKKNKKLYKKIDFEQAIKQLGPADFYYEKANGANVFYGLIYFDHV